VDDKQSEIRRSYLAGWQARMNPHEVEDKQRDIREHHLGIGVALGSGFGLAIGAGVEVAFGNLSWSIGFGLCISAGIGIALGAARGNKHAKAAAESLHTNGDGSAYVQAKDA
jgi:hypothetical protein